MIVTFLVSLLFFFQPYADSNWAVLPWAVGATRKMSGVRFQHKVDKLGLVYMHISITKTR